MKSHEFCYWLQGFFELRNAGKEIGGLSKEQVDCVAGHLALVFKHEIDAKYGDEQHQAELNEIHIEISPPDTFISPTSSHTSSDGPTFRC